jgi:hypothetical protein
MKIHTAHPVLFRVLKADGGCCRMIAEYKKSG